MVSVAPEGCASLRRGVLGFLLVGCGGGTGDVEWPVVLGDPGGQRHSALADIDTVNVDQLEEAWRWSTGEMAVGDPGPDQLVPGRFQATPVMRDGRLFLSTPFAAAVALDAGTGAELWRFDPAITSLGPSSNGHGAFVHRGVAVWGRSRAERVFLAARGTLWALDARTGAPVASFGEAGRVDLGAHLRWPVDRRHLEHTAPPIVVGDVVIVGSAIGDQLIYEQDPPGDVQAFDARTGARLWRWDPVPPPGDSLRAGWGARSADVAGHANVWSFMTADTARGLVFLPVSAASNDWYGGARPGDNRWAESVVCLEAATGRLVWAQQLVHHGLWDYDPAAPPLLATVTIGGTARDVVVQAAKSGFVHVFDRTTGAPLWPVEERAAPASDVPGEVTSPTQPVPVRPAPFARQGSRLEDAVDFTPALRDSARALLSRYRLGPLFTPPSLEGTVVRPGWLGGAGWGATSYDPASGLLLVKATEQPSLARLVPRDTVDAAGAYRLGAGSPSAPLILRVTLARPEGGTYPPLMISAVKPPWGTLTAIDLADGTIRWQVPVGDDARLREHPALADLALPPLGVAGPSGGVTTAGGLTFLTGGGDALYAMDTRTGTVRWRQPLGIAGHANPMTYRSGGRQFVVLAIGTGDRAELVAYALPEPGR